MITYRFAATLSAIMLCFTVHAQNIQVDPLSGRPQIQIPVYQLTVGDLQVPVGIQHHGNAIRATESDSDCGMGWSLIADGGVYRTVRGLPDDYSGTGTDTRKGWLFDNNALNTNNFVPTSDDNLVVCTDEVNDYNFINGLAYVKDAEPDLFSFHAPGLSGQFVFGTDGLPKLLNYQDIKIVPTKDANGKLIKFVITTNLGRSYEFSRIESSKRTAEKFKNSNYPAYFKTDYNYYRTSLTYNISWKLAQIKSPTGAVVNFTYSGTGESSSAKFYSTINASNVADTLYYLDDKIGNLLTLEKISGGIYSVDFSWQDKLLSTIAVSENVNNHTKKFDFKYKTIRSALDINDQKNIIEQKPKHFLTQLKQSDNCIPYPDYVFTYNSIVSEGPGESYIPFPDSRLTHMDIWECYNGSAPGKIPTVYYYDTQSGAERFRTEPNSGSTPTSTLTGDNRQVGAVSPVGALTKITYPTGGYTTIDYERNRYFDVLANTQYYAGGVRVKTIWTSGGEVAFGRTPYSNSHSIRKDYEYLKTDGKSSGKLMYHPVYAFTDGTNIMRSTSNLAPEGSEIMYERVTEIIKDQGRVIYEYLIPGTYPTVTDVNWKATSSKIARKPGGSCIVAGNLKNGPYTFPFPPNTNYDFERGLLTRIAEYGEDTNLTKERLFTYTRNPSTFTIVKGLRYEQMGDVFHFGQYDVLTGTSKALLTETVKMADELSPGNFLTTTTTYNYSTSHALLQSVVKQNSDLSTQTEKIKYAKDYASITTPIWRAARGVFALNAANQHGTVIEKIQSITPSGGSTIVVGAQFNIFKNFGNDQVLPFKQYSFPQNSTFTESLVSPSGSNQLISFDSLDYIPTVTSEKYTGNGNIVNQTSNNKKIASVQYGFDNTIPVAIISNARAEEVTYSGFETNTGYEWKTTSPSYTTSRTGEKALILGSTVTLQKNDVTKSSSTSTYRIACWAKAAAAANITFRILNGSTVITSTLVYPASVVNTWQYLEGQINLSAAPALFNTQVIANASVTIDDILLMPATASINTKTFLPMVGTTSETDDRGTSTQYTYDAMGRLSGTYDNNRNLIKIKEYQYQNQPALSVNASFKSSVYYGNMYKGFSSTFTPVVNCGGTVSYVWKLNGVTVSTASTLTQSFPALGNQQLELTVTTPQGSASSSISFCVIPNALSVSLQIVGGAVIERCDAAPSRTFNVLLNPGSDCSPNEMRYEWYYESGSGWQKITDPTLLTVPGSLTFNIASLGPPRSYSIKCEVSGKCGTTTSPCISTVEVFGTQIVSVIFNNTPSPQCP